MLIVVLVAVAGLLAGGLGLLAGAQAARGSAQAAADLGALAGASRVLRGSGEGCGIAREVVERNGASLAECVAEGGGVVRVRTAVAFVVGDATASARAGPRNARS